MKLRSQLLLLVASAIAPVLLLAVTVAALLLKHERERIEEDAIGRARSAMSAVDAEIRGHLTTIQALAASVALEAGDIRGFYEEARRVLRAQPQWLNIGLASADGRQLFDAARPFGAAAPMTGDVASYRRALETGQPVVGDVDVGGAVAKPAVRIRVPVLVQGQIRYVISVPLKPEGFADLLRAQQLQQNWVIALADRNKRVVARIPSVPAGTEVSPSFRSAIERSPHGYFPGVTLEGARTYTPYVTSELSGWVLGIAIPARWVETAADRVFLGMGVGTLVALGIALALGWHIARRISEPIAELAAGGFPAQTRIDEIGALAAAVREKQELAEREKAALQAADRAKDEFLAMLSHELRNPLAALTTAAHVLKLSPPGEPASIKARAVVERQTRHMARLVGDLLDISRVTMGKVALERERMNLLDLVNRVLDIWRASGRLERHQVVRDLKPVWVDADRARIEQILSNLLDNSVKFTPAGKRITVALAHEGDWAVLRVADEGEGLPRESAERMFDLFVQGERGLDRSAGGLGVGLALVKRLTELHGGTVSASSAGPGQGATFTVKLPAVLPAAQAEVPEAPARVAARRVLIVEDNDDARHMLQQVLAFSGHDVREARDAASGLALAAESQPDVALIDIGLPDLDGYEVARRLRASPGGRRMGLIAITGYGQAEDQKRAYDAGFDAHLTKPVAPERLRQVMAGLK